MDSRLSIRTDFSMTMVVQCAISYMDGSAVVTLSHLACHKIRIISGNSVTFLDGGSAIIQQFHFAASIHGQGSSIAMQNDMGFTENISGMGKGKMNRLIAIPNKYIACSGVLIVEDASRIDLSLEVGIKITKGLHHLLWNLRYHAMPILMPSIAHLLDTCSFAKIMLRSLAIPALCKNANAELLKSQAFLFYSLFIFSHIHFFTFLPFYL